MSSIRDLKDFLDHSHSPYHAAANLAARLDADGYTRLSEGADWQLEKGGKYYFTRGGCAVFAFRIPTADPVGFSIAAAHSDRPSFKLKENGVLEGKYTRLSVEGYGGMLIGTWLDRPLSLAGRVQVATEHGAESRLVDIDRDLLLIPNLAIHMNRAANDGYKWDLKSDTMPLFAGADKKAAFQEILTEVAGGEILGQDLYLYPRMDAALWGSEEEFISACALDDLQCVWCCAEGFKNAKESASIPVLSIFDSEEVGSSSMQGADSNVLERLIRRICAACGLDADRMLSNSFLVSADNAHALHPNRPEMADSTNAPLVNGGPVLKFNANLRYTTDGLAAAIFRSVCRKAGVNVQTYHNRADIPGGSTLGHISMAHVSVPTADVGLAQLAMHSCYETAGTRDSLDMVRVMETFYGLTLTRDEQGFALN